MTDCTCPFQRHLFPQCTQEKELRDLLRSNDSPSAFQVAHCRSISTSLPAELERYDDEILRLNAALFRAESERAAVQDYSRLCDAVMSPVRRLPAEILVDIFGYFTTALHWPWLEFPRSDSIEEEMRRVANVELLRVAQVCPRWHQLVMGTPSLWSCIELDLCQWTAPDSRLLLLLKTVLDRGESFPLDLGIVWGNRDATSRVLELLASYSTRWRHVAFMTWTSPLDEYSKLSAIAGNLPLLSSLAINTGWNDVEAITFFEGAPQLVDVRFNGLPAKLPKLPLEQLKNLGLGASGPEDLTHVAATATRLSREVAIAVFSSTWEETATIQAVPRVSNVHVLSVRVIGPFDAAPARSAMRDWMLHFTLPHLDHLWFDCSQYAGVPLPWPADHFLALAHRSSFSSHLTVLELDPVFITEAELLQVLDVLQSLDNLTISDHKRIPGAPTEYVLLTDALLRCLTWTPGPACLAPALSYLGCHTLLKFDDDVYRDFVLSRIGPGRNEDGPFEVELFWDSDNQRDLDSVFSCVERRFVSTGAIGYCYRNAGAFQGTLFLILTFPHGQRPPLSSRNGIGRIQHRAGDLCFCQLLFEKDETRPGPRLKFCQPPAGPLQSGDSSATYYRTPVPTTFACTQAEELKSNMYLKITQSFSDYIRGLCFERPERTLDDAVIAGAQFPPSFLDGVEEAIKHLHSLGYAHNDLNPHNIMISKAGDPILIDFDSSLPLGLKLTKGGTFEWEYEGGVSAKENDLWALAELREWIEGRREY
ncbi:hypothetical protein FB45DRAFT_998768 [Roridomyces roridus]|uniref:F-box domain-containing protein n=1 Tax=Roridomyces roridus TaxID=1738132 RepID=A0AAD7CGP1_9AGAR|nr:hypothetical protein FB45DRAFT_998768 [Roridomyces roridus]